MRAVDRRDARVVLVRVERETVHERRRPAAVAVRLPQVVDEDGGRVRRPDTAPDVAAARRDRAAEHRHPRRRRLHRVVGQREQRLVGRRRSVAAVLVELRQPVAIEVRFVADDHDLQGGHPLHDRGGVGGELQLVLLAHRRRPAARVHHARQNGDVRELRGGGHVVEHGLVVIRERALAGNPDLGDPNAAKAREREQVHLGLRLGERDRAHGVLGRSEDERGSGGRRGGSERERRDDCRDPQDRRPH